MTALYEFPLLVAPISLACPSCGGEAVFRTRHDKPLPVMRAGETPGRAVADWSGELHCPACARRSPHVLVWPDQAYYQVEHRGQVLWALDRPMMQTFRSVIAAGADRARQGQAHRVHVARLPSVFLSARARPAMLRKIDRLLQRDRKQDRGDG